VVEVREGGHVLLGRRVVGHDGQDRLGVM
jgi:hypothetical protein